MYIGDSSCKSQEGTTVYPGQSNGIQWVKKGQKLHEKKWGDNVNPGLINSVYGCFIGGIPSKYQIMTIWGVPPSRMQQVADAPGGI